MLLLLTLLVLLLLGASRAVEGTRDGTFPGYKEVAAPPCADQLDKVIPTRLRRQVQRLARPRM